LPACENLDLRDTGQQAACVIRSAGVSMRFKHVFVLTALVSVLLIAASAARVAAFPASAPPLLIDAAFTCGMFDGSFSCRAAPGEEAHGKNASPGVSRTPNAPSDGLTGDSQGTAYPAPAAPSQSGAPAATPDAASTGCQHGMIGTPPGCRCPKNSELLGGNCVHYTATMCKSELPVNVNPEPCQDLEAKLSCKMRQDGLKDCCCVVYDKM
jgi:hypothetical protein